MKFDLNISDRDKRLIFAAVSIGLLILAFKFGFSNFNAKSAVVEKEISELKAEYDNLYKMYEQEPFYKKQIVEFNATSDEILTKYATNYSQEYMIMFLRNLESSENWISTYNIPVGTNTATLAADAAGTYVAHSGAVSVGFTSTYDAMLTFIKNLNDNPKKTSISNISLTYNEKNGTVTGSAALNLYAITGPNRTPENVMNGTASVLIGKDKSGLFESDTFNPDMSAGDESTSTKIREDNDLYVLVNQWGSSLDNVIVGFSKDNSGRYNLATNTNDKHKITITISGSEGNYKAAYQLDDKAIEATSFVAGDTIDILISSSARPVDGDNVAVDVNIKNNSDKTVNYTVINDDETNRRVSSNHSGDVVLH